jgi:GDP-L-fucose synthase
MKHYEASDIINIGTGEDVSIRELAELIKSVVGYRGEIVMDASKPDGTPRKLLDVTKVNRVGWKAAVDLKSGIERTYGWFLEHYNS